MKWNHLAEDRDMLYAFVNTGKNRFVSSNAKKSLITEEILASRDGLYSIESVANWTYCISDVVAENRRWDEGV
jgi:hypothetical protein